MTITRRQLLKRLRSLQGPNQDHEGAHGEADDLLLKYIDDPLITKEYDAIVKWYA